MRRILMGILALGLAACAGAVRQAPQGETVTAFGWLGELAGGCWSGTGADGRAYDTQCYDWQYGRFLRGTIRMDAHGGRPGEFAGDSVFAWDAKAKRIRYWFWGSDGNFGEAEAYYEGEWLRFPVPAKEGLRHSWRRLDADAFQVVREQKDSRRWQEKLVVTYRRGG